MTKTSHTARAFASRPVRFAFAMKIAFVLIGANVSFAAAKAIFSTSGETPAAVKQIAAAPAPKKPVFMPVSEATQVAAMDAAVKSAQARGCRLVDVQTDEGYGVSGHVTRTVCNRVM